jgi:hypothetical protein
MYRNILYDSVWQILLIRYSLFGNSLFSHTVKWVSLFQPYGILIFIVHFHSSISWSLENKRFQFSRKIYFLIQNSASKNLLPIKKLQFAVFSSWFESVSSLSSTQLKVVVYQNLLAFISMFSKIPPQMFILY